jgi:hypothetical protein
VPDRNPARLMVPLSEEEIDELDDFLMSDAVSDETMMLDQLDGYLTAIIIGPTTLRMQDWLSGIWGPGEEHAPEFETMDQAQRILDLITRYMNGIVWSFQDDPDAFEPMFNMVTSTMTRKNTWTPKCGPMVSCRALPFAGRTGSPSTTIRRRLQPCARFISWGRTSSPRMRKN